jgi:hypothetical protein
VLEKIKEIKEKAKADEESQYKDITAALQMVRSEKKKGSTKNFNIDLSNNVECGADFNFRKKLYERRSSRDKKRKAEIQIGDEVRIKTLLFGKQYAKGRPEYMKGKVITTKNKKAGVRYEEGKEIYDTNVGYYLEKIFLFLCA